MLYDVIIPAYANGLSALSSQLAKAQGWAEDRGIGESQLIAARLAPDMFPLTAQVRFTCLQTVQTVARLGASEAPSLAEDATDLASLQAQIAATQQWLDKVEIAAFDPDRTISFDLPNGMIFDLTALAYLRDWAQPQFYFHLVTAYAILRQFGVPLGKADYVGYMMSHLRPGSAPAG